MRMDAPTPQPASAAAYERLRVAATPERTLEALRDALRARAMTEYAVIDHGHDMAAAGVPGHPAWTLVFGNPAAGEPLLARDLAAAVDIPLRLAVIGTAPGTSDIVIRPMSSLLGKPLAEIADAFTGVLRSLASAARDAAEAGRAGS
jgi:uncharacterized protein (DUF302 family)